MDEDGNPDSGDGHQPAPGQHSFVSAKDPVGYEHIADSERTPGVGPGAAEMPDLADRQPFQQGCRGDGGVDFAQTSGSHNHDELSIVAPPEGLASESKRPAVQEDLGQGADFLRDCPEQENVNIGHPVHAALPGSIVHTVFQVRCFGRVRDFVNSYFVPGE